MSKKVLFIVEGELEEPRILDAKGRGILSLIDGNFQIVSYNTSIYDLYTAYKNDEYDDLVSFLVSNNKIKLDKGEIPKTAFSAIYLVFDYEPHYHKYSDETVRDLLNTFDDETNLGKLYINYPTVESYYHLKNIIDKEYINRVVDLKEFNGKKYKKLVYQESFINHKPISKEYILAIFVHNYLKAEHITNCLFEDEIKHKEILDKQIEFKNKENKLYVLNTLCLFPFDYNPSLFKKYIKMRRI